MCCGLSHSWEIVRFTPPRIIADAESACGNSAPSAWLRTFMSSSVSEWLQSVPWLARTIDSTRYELAIVRNKPEQNVILNHLVSRLQSSVQNHAEASLAPPPYELVGALFLDGERRMMRKDAWGLFMDNFNRQEKFFLQVCR